MYIQIKSKLCTTSVIAVVFVLEIDLYEVEIKFKDIEALMLARLNLSNVGLTVSERAIRRMRIKGYKQLLIK